MSRKARIILIVVVCLLALPVALVMFENWRGRHDWERYKAEMEAKGEHLEMEDFIPPPVPDEKNFMMNPVFTPLFQDSALARTVTISGSMIDLDKIRPEIDINSKADRPASKGGWSNGVFRDLKAWQTYYRATLHDVVLDKSPAEDVLAALGRYDGVFDLLRETAKTKPLSRDPLHYEKGFAMALPQYSGMQKMIHVLSLRACAELDLNRTDDALADVLLEFRLLEAIKDDPLLISGLVRMTWLNILMQPVWEGIASHRWNNGQLEQIEGRLRQIDFLSDYENTMRGERAGSNFIYALVRVDPAALAQELEFFGDKPARMALSATRYFPGLIYQNQISINRLMQEKILPLADVKTRRFSVKEAVKSKEYFDNSRNFSPYSYLSKITLPVYLSIAEKYALTQTYADEALIACEIERYRLAQGKLPATLEELHMADLPHDIINGEPLHYKVTGEDYLLYSVGWNETDDGGKLALRPNSTTPDTNQGDWVWSLKPL